jgi:hypothetical protein
MKGEFMEEKKSERGYPVYAENELSGVEMVISSCDCTGLEPTPPANESEAESYANLYNIPQYKENVNNGFQMLNPEKAKGKSNK